MLIGGKPVDGNDVESVISALNSLPTGFSSRNIASRKFTYKSSEAEKSNQLGMKAWNEWDESSDSPLLQRAADHFQRAAELSEEAGDLRAHAQNRNNYGWAMVSADTPEKAIPAFESACAIYQQQEMTNLLFEALGGLHRAMLDTVHAKEAQGLTDEAAELRAQLRPVRQRSLQLFSARKGEGQDFGAYRIEQGELGFSAKQKIGTDNVNDCICIILQNPATQKTALAHIDSDTNIHSLEQVFARLEGDFSSQKNNQKLQARIIGACYDADSGQSMANIKSRRNLENSIRFLNERHVDVLSAVILDKNQPTSIVVDPATFTVAEKSPGIPNPDMHIANMKPCTITWGKPLQTVIDLTVSDERAAVYFSRSAIANIRRLHEKQSEEPIYHMFSNYAPQQLPCVVEGMVLLSEAYQHESGRLKEKLIAKVLQLAETGSIVPAYEVDRAVFALSDCPLHLGQGAEKANAALERVIDRDVFKVTGKTVVTDIASLQRFEFPVQPYDALEARVRDEQKLAGAPPELHDSVRAFQAARQEGLPSGVFNPGIVKSKRNIALENTR
jgi:hypothetical protein